MSEFWSALGGCLVAVAGAFLVSTLSWGSYPWWKARLVRRKYKHEHVRMVSDVNTKQEGYRISKNRVTKAVTLLGLLVWILKLYDQPEMLEIGVFIAGIFWGRETYKRAPWQQLHTFVLTSRSVVVFPAGAGRALWNIDSHKRVLWSEVDTYRIAGQLVQLYREERVELQFAFHLKDRKRLCEWFALLSVKRGEVRDRVWLGQFDEVEFFRLEEELMEIGWTVIDLYRPELQALGLQPEFGVVRNVTGDRVQEEHARSWLQLNLVDEEGEQLESVTLLLWECSGNYGELIGVEDQEAVELLQEWVGHAIRNVQAEQEGSVWT